MMNINQPIYPNAYANMITPRTNGILWVQGIEGAKAWQMPANSNVMLLDSETDGRFYIKTSDNIGMCNLRVFEYKEITNEPKQEPVIDMSQYVTKDELNEAIKSIKEKRNEQSIQSNKQFKQKSLITE